MSATVDALKTQVERAKQMVTDQQAATADDDVAIQALTDELRQSLDALESIWGARTQTAVIATGQ